MEKNKQTRQTTPKFQKQFGRSYAPPHQVWNDNSYVIYCGTHTWPECGGRSCRGELKSLRQPRTRGQSRQRARRRSSKSPQAWGDRASRCTIPLASLCARLSCLSSSCFAETLATGITTPSCPFFALNKILCLFRT